MVLRQYQKECIDRIEEKGAGRWLVAVAVGLGKTVIFTHLPRHGRTLILSHRDELVRQPEKYYDNVTFGVEKAEEHSNGEEVVSASVQSLSRDDRLARFSPDAFDTIIVDEAHHAAAPSYRKVLDYFSGARRRIGFTATPKRGDGVRLTDVFDEIVYEKSLKWGIEHKYLTRLRSMNVKASYNLKSVKKQMGDFSQKELGNALRDSDAIPVAAKTYVQECQDRHTLIYCVTIDICRALKDTISDMIPNPDTVQVLTGDTPDEERKAMLKDFTEGKVRCIINCMVLTEGTDLPIADTIINLRPTCNPSLFEQMVGRCCRTYPGKEYSLVIDITPDDKTRGLCSAPTLFGIDPSRLDKKYLDQLDKNHDLLDECDKIIGSEADLAEKIDLDIEIIDLFLCNAESIIRENAKKGYVAIAQALKNAKQLDDFGSLIVEAQADENKRYVIKPSWDERIFISAPDVMENVSIEFDLLQKPEDSHSKAYCYKGTMKMDEAVDLATRFCGTKRGTFAYMWDKNVADVWEQMPSTENQRSRVRRDFSDYHVKNDSNSLNKRDASELIDLATRIRKEQSYMGTLLQAKEECENRSENQNALEQYIEEKEKGDQGFDEFVKKITEPPVVKSRSRDAATYFLENGEIKIKVYPSYVPGFGMASSKQVNYIVSLMASVTARGFVIPKVDYTKITKAQAAGLIPLLCEMCNLSGRKDKIYIKNFDKIMEMFDLHMGKGTVTIKL